ncbi:unnamed protein product [Pieris brassicae]|uniref:Uncharacterized protein n=1 Tax=Pieris brassicae TaxID=7116 RepID=A0A9P0XDQ0_PIEBR|nr:unnamed protein product [Pieris brassicae]
MKFLLLCLLVAYCYADNSSESLLSKIEDHQKRLSVWEEVNSGFLSTLVKKQKDYDNAKKNEDILLKTFVTNVENMVKTNKGILKGLLIGLEQIRHTVKEDNLEIDENGLTSTINDGTDSDTLTLQWINEIMKENNETMPMDK